MLRPHSDCDTQHTITTAGEGVNFRVVDVDTFSRNEVVGRCFCSAKVMQQAMKSNTPIVMSLGEECAEMPYNIELPEPYRASAAPLRFARHCRPIHDLAEAACPSVLAQTASESSRCWCTDR